MSLRLGIDIGGTFTDFVLISPDGQLSTAKVLSSKEDLTKVVEQGLETLARCQGKTLKKLLSDIELIIHGTTIATNAVIQGTFAKVGMITTAGFRDVLEIREGRKENRYDYSVPPPRPLVPRRFRLTVSERNLKDGTVLTALDEDDVARAIKVFEDEGIEAVAVCLLWAIANPAHEQKIAQMLEKRLPGIPFYLSSEVSQKIREYPRFSTTALCAALSTRMTDYVQKLEIYLRSIGYQNAIRYSQCNGGTTSSELLKERPVLALDSGPACGPTAGVFFAQQFGIENAVIFDMGGTSLDVSLVKGGDVDTASNVDAHGYRVQLPMVNVRTVGAGGGSLAEINDSGILQVGPQSAESMPGPACYGRGGTRPTVTDANVVLGYFNSEALLAGKMPIDASRSFAAIEENIAKPLGVGVHEAALGIYSVVNERMAGTVRQISTEKGYDIRDFALICGGGCSAAHAAKIAESLGVSTVIIPRVSSLLCSFGASITEIRHDYAGNYGSVLEECDVRAIEDQFRSMYAQARADLTSEGVLEGHIQLNRTMDVRYKGELGELTIDVTDIDFASLGMSAVASRFHDTHEKVFTFADPDSRCELMGLGVTGRGGRPEPLQRLRSAGLSCKPTKSPIPETRVGWFERGEGVRLPVYVGDTVGIGELIDGPAVIEEEMTTIVVPPYWSSTLSDQYAWIMREHGWVDKSDSN